MSKYTKIQRYLILLEKEAASCTRNSIKKEPTLCIESSYMSYIHEKRNNPHIVVHTEWAHVR